MGFAAFLRSKALGGWGTMGNDNQNEIVNSGEVTGGETQGEARNEPMDSGEVTGGETQAEIHTDPTAETAEKIGNSVAAIVQKVIRFYHKAVVFVKAQSGRTRMIAGGIALAVIVVIAGIYQLSLNSARKEAEILYLVNEKPAAAYNKIKKFPFSFAGNRKFQNEKRVYLRGMVSSVGLSSAAPKAARPTIMIQGLALENRSKSSYTRANGTAYNAGSSKASFVKVKILFKDAAGKVIDTDWTYAVGSEGLNPGESKKFTCSVKYDARIKSVSYEFID
jgi:hypothetical protein